MTFTPPPLPADCGQLRAQASWQRIDFISDIHLQATEPATAAAWRAHLAHTPADALFILGDLFEVWIGDDDDDAFVQQCIAALAATAQRMPVFFMCGNRDFLAGPGLMRASGMRALPDPTVLDLGDMRLLLSHGDLLCLADTDYLAFRAQVRTPAWQAAFLAKPLAERAALARGLRAQSEARKHSHADYADVDAAAARHWLDATQTQVLVHGHTHRPGQHLLAPGQWRWVLSDWEAEAQPPRLEVSVWQRGSHDNGSIGLRRLPLSA